MALSLVLGTAQTRIKRPRLGVFAQGFYDAEEVQGSGRRRSSKASGWSRQLFDHVYQEPVDGNLMLLPYCMEAAWSSTFTGDYARLTFADFGLVEGSDPGEWRQGGLQGRMAKDEGMASAAVSVATYGGDRGFVLGFYGNSTGQGKTVLYDFGIGGDTIETASAGLRFFNGSTVEVWKGGALVGEGGCGGENTEFNRFLILPMNVRQLLVLSLSKEEGFIHTFDDVDESTPAPRIFPDEPVWFHRPSGMADVEIAPVSFYTTGSVYSTRGALAEVPDVSETPETPEAFRRIEQGGTVAPFLTNLAGVAYDPATDTQDVRLKLEMTGPGTHTPFVQGAVAGFPCVTAETDASASVEMRPRAMRVRLSVPESPEARLSFDMMGRELGVDDLEWELERITNIPLDAKLGSLAPFFRGQSGPSPVVMSAVEAGHLISADFRDELALSEPARYRDPYPFDGLNLRSAIIRCGKHEGLTDAQMDVQTTAFALPFAESPSRGEWSEIARAGDAVGDIRRRLLETYAATWLWGWFPTATGRMFRAGAPDVHFGDTPKLTIYGKRQDAIDLGGYSPDDGELDGASWRFVYTAFESTRLRIEANEIRFSAFDPKTQKIIQARHYDAASADPSTPYDLRPDNWEGELLTCSFFDPRVTTQEAAVRACGILAGRLAVRREVCRFECELLLDPETGQPLWRGDVVELHGKGVYRINTVEAEWVVSEPDDVETETRKPLRRCKATYTATKGAGAALGIESPGTSLEDVKHAHDRASAIRTRVRAGGEFMLSRPVAIQAVAPLLTE